MNNWKQNHENIETVWAEKIDRNAPFNEYPRPQMVRSRWKNLNGLWDFAVQKKTGTAPKSYKEQILVPFAIETAASGTKRSLLPEEILWYRKSIKIPQDWSGDRIILHFEAVDWQCTCFINGKEIGSHKGGYIPFHFDITDYLQGEENELTLSVWDPTDSRRQQRGKQTLNPKGCFYTATSGIWQSVWLEPVPIVNHIKDIRLTPMVDSSSLLVNIKTDSPASIRISVFSSGNKISTTEIQNGTDCTIGIDEPHLWSPEDPFLYELKLELLNEDKVADTVDSYFAMRKITAATGKNGFKTVRLNDRSIFLHGPLDQGYWPESGMTPPTEEAIIFDLEKTKALGFNMTRKHIKVEPRRWYYHADRLGLVVIQDMISGGKDYVSPLGFVMQDLLGTHFKDTSERYKKTVGRIEPDSQADFERELIEMMNHLHNSPSVLIWCPFNEAWGQYDAARICALVKGHDPSRLVDHASGWYDQWVGDFNSRHRYTSGLRPPRKGDERVYFISEYGGYNLKAPGNMWNEKKKFGYKSYKDKDALQKAYTNLIQEQIIPLLKEGLGAAVYTQFSDVEIESNGYYSYDRKVLKFDEQLVYDLNQEVYSAFDSQES